MTKGAIVKVKILKIYTFFTRNKNPVFCSFNRCFNVTFQINQVRVKNDMPIETASVHWHGIHQTNNYWMDGAPYLSQCPILPK